MSKKRQAILVLSVLILNMIFISIYNENKRIEKLSNPNYLTNIKTGNTWRDILNNNKKEGTWNIANSYCESLKVDGVKGNWSLPSITELDEAYVLDSKLKESSGWLHWSSTPVKSNSKLVYSMNFHGGMTLTLSKTRKARIKCINRNIQN